MISVNRGCCGRFGRPQGSRPASSAALAPTGDEEVSYSLEAKLNVFEIWNIDGRIGNNGVCCQQHDSDTDRIL